MAKTTIKPEEDQIEMTQDAFDELSKELQYRKDILREEIAKEIAEARELGDLSENHAYSVAMEKKEQNENRITELEDMLKKAKVVTSAAGNVVRVGKTVEIENLERKEKRIVTLVGSEETQSAEPNEGKISVDSPIGKAILNAKVGDEVEVHLPSKVVKYKIIKFI